jgi:16S rRNA (guanine966-N2)-methyltransferase
LVDNRVRIIGGRHRGRRLAFPQLPGLRPTGDRIRETLFNWLQPALPGARCLDLFAGSGALGLEAASRGAGKVVLVERAGQAARQLQENVRLLGEPQVTVFRADALEWLTGSVEPFDIVFLDPPFTSSLLEACCNELEKSGWLAPSALIYLETEAAGDFSWLPEPWRLEREKCSGGVRFALARHNPVCSTVVEGADSP